MQANDSFSFQLNESRRLTTSLAETSLISIERSQKLDLLIHLISNLRQSLVICGPGGIGKTTLLDELTLRKNDVWPIVTIQSSDHLSFESIQKQILQFLTQYYPECKNQELTAALSSLDKQGQKIVILIDEAGKLVPGLISNVIQYAVAFECLRVVFSLTQDELHLKSNSDKVIDDCHFIEIPPLTEKQCGVFLQNLSAKPNAIISFNAINEYMVERLYRQTHGIPGKIMTELPKLSDYKSSISYSWLIGVFFIAIIIAVGVKLFGINEPDVELEKEKIKTALVFKKAEVVDIVSPVIHSDVVMGQEVDSIESDIEKESTKAVSSFAGTTETSSATINNESLYIKPVLTQDKKADTKSAIQSEVDEINKSGVISEKKVIVSEKTKKIELPLVLEQNTIQSERTDKVVVKKEKTIQQIEPKQNNQQWILSQPKKNYAIQLIVLSKRESVDEFVRKNKTLKEHLKFFLVNKPSPKYVIIYGSFKNAVSATRKMKSLPVKYRKSWVRKYSDLQKEIKK